MQKFIFFFIYMCVTIIVDNRGGIVRNRKAQALIEFVLILPILIMILFAVIDFGNIFVAKSSLENKINDAYQILKESTDTTTLQADIENVVKNSDKDITVTLDFNNERELIILSLSKDIKTITPGLNLILGYPYKIKTERVIKYGSI